MFHSTSERQPIEIPENPYKVFVEITKHPIGGFGDAAYSIPRDTATKLFPNVGSPKSILQGCKVKLAQHGIIEILRSGSVSQEVVVRVLRPNVIQRQGGQGRRAGKSSRPRAETSFTGVEDTSVLELREHLRRPAKRVFSYLRLMERVLTDYPDLFDAQFIAKTRKETNACIRCEKPIVSRLDAAVVANVKNRSRCEHCQEYARHWQKARTAKLQLANKCVSCRSEDARTRAGKVRCRECTEKRKPGA